MKRVFVIVVVGLILSTQASAEPWTLSADANLILTQNAYSDNWVGGESGAISWTFNSNWLAERQLNPKIHTKNTLKLLFGQTHNQDVETRDWAKPVKSTDLIDFESVLRFTLGAFVDPYAGFRIETQFLDQSDPELDRYFTVGHFPIKRQFDRRSQGVGQAPHDQPHTARRVGVLHRLVGAR